MAAMKLALFGKSKILEAQIDEFFDTVSQGGMLFEETVRHYRNYGTDSFFTQRVEQISDIETTADHLVKTIVTELYSEMLIPEFRADVLSLLQGIDSLLDQFKSTCFTIYIERPQMDDLPEEFGIAFNDLVKSVVQSVEVLLSAARAFFRDIHAVRDHLHKVKLLEGEADKIAGHLLGEIFKSKLPLERKIHVRYFIDMVDNIADEAEDTADKLAIYAIKRAL